MTKNSTFLLPGYLVFGANILQYKITYFINYFKLFLNCVLSMNSVVITALTFLLV